MKLFFYFCLLLILFIFLQKYHREHFETYSVYDALRDRDTPQYHRCMKRSQIICDRAQSGRCTGYAMAECMKNQNQL